jgi:hypothetical protein
VSSVKKRRRKKKKTAYKHIKFSAGDQQLIWMQQDPVSDL